MPSREMRSTRVFGTRVLRSGRKLLSEPREGRNHRKVHNGGRDCIELVNKSSEGGNSRNEIMNVMQEDGTRGLIVEHMVAKSAPDCVIGLKDEERFGIVYSRKRKRSELTSKGLLLDKKFGIKYARKEWRKKPRLNEPLELIVFAYELSCDSTYWITRFLTSVLSYMMKIRLGVRTLSAFVFSEPIFNSYYSRGVLFLKDSISFRSPGFCIISGSRSLMPIFSVDFSAMPFGFMRMHTSMYIIKSVRFVCFDSDSPCVHEKEEEPMNNLDGIIGPFSGTPFGGGNHSDFVPVASGNDDFGVKRLSSSMNILDGTMQSCSESPIDCGDHSDFVPVASGSDNSGNKRSSSSTRRKSHLLNVQLREIQKRRTSLRLKKKRSTSANRETDGGSPSADFRRIKHGSAHFSSTAPSRVPKGSSSNKKKSTTISAKAIKSDLVNMKHGVSTSICSANLLVTEPEKCYREEGVIITLERSITKQLCLAVKKNGINRYTLTAEKVMRPPGSNRINNATVWAGDGSWKLEFPDKQDWLVFKELYKECSEQNGKASASIAIPIPTVQEVSNLYDSDYVPFVRPDSYITVKDDELRRALLKTGANYDMDSDDEKWLKNFNEELFVAGELQQLTPDRFEWIIDAIEKSIHCTGDENYIVQTQDVNFMPIESVRSYWIKKRKQKHSSFLRTLQLYQQTRRDPVTTKPVLRKKRSFKRQKSHGGRDKPQLCSQGIAEETVVAEERKAQQQKRNLQQAIASANNLGELAVLKRLRAQKLMENADLATYKAVIALRIAEAAQVATSESLLGTIASYFLN